MQAPEVSAPGIVHLLKVVRLSVTQGVSDTLLCPKCHMEHSSPESGGGQSLFKSAGEALCRIPEKLPRLTTGPQRF